MATSGSYNFSLDRNQIIKSALEEVSAADIFDEVPQEYINLGNRRLNMMIKSWQTRGVSLPFTEEIIVFLPTSTSELTLSPTGSNACLASDFVSTTLNVTAASGSSSITVSSATGLAISDYIGIQLDDNTRQWTTISNIAGTTITLATTLTGNAASANVVYSYTNKIQKPMRFLDVRRRSQGIDIPVEILARKDWFNLATKSYSGNVTQIHYQPKNTEGNLYIWQQNGSINDNLRCTVEYPAEDFDSASNDSMYPSEWYEAMIYGLAWRLGTGGKFGVSESQLANLKAIADEAFAKVNDFDQEYTYVDFEPNLNGRY